MEQEPGAAIVAGALRGSIISSVNWAEVATFYARLGGSADSIEQHLGLLPVLVVDATHSLALAAGAISPMTRSAGLSLGDRFCLALARVEGVPAMTADKAWRTVADAVGVEVRLIR